MVWNKLLLLLITIMIFFFLKINKITIWQGSQEKIFHKEVSTSQCIFLHSMYTKKEKNGKKGISWTPVPKRYSRIMGVNNLKNLLKITQWFLMQFHSSEKREEEKTWWNLFAILCLFITSFSSISVNCHDYTLESWWKGLQLPLPQFF